MAESRMSMRSSLEQTIDSQHLLDDQENSEYSDIIKICKQLVESSEPSHHNPQIIFYGMEFLSSEACTSPESQSSDSSSDKRSKAKESKSRKKCTTHKPEDDTDSDTQSPVRLSDETTSTQESTIDSTVQAEEDAFTFPTTSPNWTFPCNFEHRSEVSPVHSLDDQENSEYSNIIKLCKQIISESSEPPQWRISSDDMEFLSSEACMSPESQSSDSSSELGDLPQYTVLNSDSTDDLLLPFSHHFP